VSPQKKCKQCAKEFEVTDFDLNFFKKISPTFDPPASAGPEALRAGGKTFEVPAPTLCYECRLQRRLMRRNERALYKRKCDHCQKDVVSVFAENSGIKVHCNKCWWSDKWNPLDYGIEYDEDKPFFEQFNELYKKVPQLGLMNDEGTGSENCEYCQDFAYGKNCYFMTGCWRSENSMYCHESDRSKYVVDSDLTIDSEICYECMSSSNLYNCFYVNMSDASRDCILSYDLKGCSNCIECYGLRNKSYFIKNQQSTKEEFEKRKAEILKTRASIEKARVEFDEWCKNKPRRFANMVNCENCTGNVMRNCKNSYAYSTYNAVDCRYFNNGDSPISCLDVFQSGKPQMSYEGVTPDECYLALFTVWCWKCRNVLYSENCHNSDDLFGCTALKHGKYCILNKQYTKEEYEQLVAKIITNMQRDGEWGEFFPISISPFGYNEAMARDFFPLSKEDALKLGAKWQDTDYSSFNGTFYEPKETIEEYIGNEEEQKKLLAGAIKCRVTSKPFRIIPQELAFYMEHKLPIPTICFDQRFENRLARRYKLKLYAGKCMNEAPSFAGTTDGKCPNTFTTIYGPQDKEIVYCADCYEKSMI